MKPMGAWAGTALAVTLSCWCLPGDSRSQDTPLTTALEQRYNRMRTFQARFVQRYTLGQVTRVESGTVYFQKPGRMRWEYDAPEKKLFLSDGAHVYLYVPDEKQVSRSRLSGATDWNTPFALLLGRVDFGRLFSRVEIKPASRPGQRPLTQLRGLPKSSGQGFTEIWLDINARQQLERIEIRQSDGTLMEFHFRDWQENHPLAPSFFRLRVPPGTAWLDGAAAP